MQFALTVKLLLNLHNLNNERAEEIRRVPVIYATEGDFKLVDEAVAVSGVMLKHWHFIYLVERAQELGISTCPLCKRGEAIRVLPIKTTSRDRKGKHAEGTADKMKNNDEYSKKVAEWLNIEEKECETYLDTIGGNEDGIIKLCIGEDVHGFLRTKPEPLRRESIVKFSWLLPIYLREVTERVGTPTPFRVVQQSRNIREVPKEPEELAQMQMPYPRAYADGIFGFVSLANLELIGLSFTSKNYVINDGERMKRQRALIEAFIPMVTGVFGASLARALPAAKPLEVVAIVSKNAKVSFPAPVHPMYEDYFELNIKMFKDFANAFNVDVSVYAYGIGKTEDSHNDNFEVKTVESPVAVLSNALDALGLKESESKESRGT